MKWAEIQRKFSEGEVPLPSWWGGFRVVPREIEFWQGHVNRLHDRFLYTALEAGALENRTPRAVINSKSRGRTAADWRRPRW